MLLLLLPILFLSTGVNSQNDHFAQRRSAASESQIRFAVENKYDQTGPGAKGKEYAYNTYKTLEEALVGYLDDPDTKLPKHEREKAEQGLIGQKPTYLQKHKESIFLNAPSYTNKNLYNVDLQVLHPNEYHHNYGYVKSLELSKLGDPFRFNWVQSVRSSPLNLAHFTRDPVPVPAAQGQQEYDANPHYSFSYGVHDKLTSDSKAARESRAGDLVRGFYTFRDADGSQRTVHYTADDAQGFKALVKRTDGSGQ